MQDNFDLKDYLYNNKLLVENFDYENDEYRKNPEYYDKLHQDMKKEKDQMAKDKSAGKEVPNAKGNGSYGDHHLMNMMEENSEVTKTLRVNIDSEALGELDDEFAIRNNVKIQIPKEFDSIDFKSLTPKEKFMMSSAPVKFTGTKDSLADLLNGDLAAQIYGDEDAYFNMLNRLFKKPKI